jgi:hypothetical protein
VLYAYGAFLAVKGRGGKDDVPDEALDHHAHAVESALAGLRAALDAIEEQARIELGTA